MDDYYSMLGVDADAKIDDIRDAYRTRKEGLDTGSDAGKADAAKLNRAWNVLSDPYQRGRYDEQRSQAIDNDELEESDNGVGSSTRSTKSGRDLTPRQQRAQAAREARSARLNAPPTIKPPEGTHYPRVKQRLIAMAIDLAIIVPLFFLAGYVAQQTHEYKVASDASTAVDNANKAVDTANKNVDTANKSGNQAEKDAANAAQKKAKDAQKAANDALNKANDDLRPVNLEIFGVYFLICGLYLVVPSGISGRTLGKSLQHLKVVRQNGAPLGFMGALSRYGLILVVTFVISFLLPFGPLGGLLVLFGVTLWTRNPNQQGMHDRFAKTIVVADDSAA